MSDGPHAGGAQPSGLQFWIIVRLKILLGKHCLGGGRGSAEAAKAEAACTEARTEAVERK